MVNETEIVPTSLIPVTPDPTSESKDHCEDLVDEPTSSSPARSPGDCVIGSNDGSSLPSSIDLQAGELNDPTGEDCTENKEVTSSQGCLPPPPRRSPNDDRIFIDKSIAKAKFCTQTNLRKPEKIGHFSCRIDLATGKQEFDVSKEAMRYLVTSSNNEVHHDLLRGFTEAWRENRSLLDNQLDILKWVVKEPEGVQVDIICDQKILEKFMGHIADKEKRWQFVAVKVRGSIIIVDITPGKLTKSDYCREKFAEKMTRRFDGKKNGEIDIRKTFHTVTQLEHNGIKLLYSSRVAGTLNREKADKPVGQMTFVQIELKPYDLEDKENVEKKKRFWQTQGMYWWISATLSDIETILCGTKEPGSYVKQYGSFRREDLVNPLHKFSPAALVQSFGSIIAALKAKVTEDLVPYNLSNEPGKVIFIKRLSEPADKYIPSWYINHGAEAREQ